MLSHTRMGVPYEYTHMGCPIRVWANIRIWGRTEPSEHCDGDEAVFCERSCQGWIHRKCVG